jgi:hypothetical protein
MIPTTAALKFRPDGAAQVDVSLHLTVASRIQCCLYPDRPAILAINDAHVSVSVCPPDSAAVTAEDLATARRLAAALARYISDLEAHVPAPAAGTPAAAAA